MPASQAGRHGFDPRRPLQILTMSYKIRDLMRGRADLLRRLACRACAGAFSAVVVGAVIAPAIPLHAEECIVLEDFSTSTLNAFPSGCTRRAEAGKKVYTVIKEGELVFLRASATGPKSAGNGIEADRPVKWNIDEYPVLRWQWRPRVFPRGADERSGKEDSALGVYIGFCPPDSLDLCERSLKGQLSLTDRIRLPKLLVSQGVGSLKYIWSERLPKGLEFERGRKSVKVLESGAPADRNNWVQERVNVAADYRRRFGAEKLLN